MSPFLPLKLFTKLQVCKQFSFVVCLCFYVFNETYKKICSEFFPQSDRYEYAHSVELEVYPSDKTDDPDYTCEIWIAVNEK